VSAAAALPPLAPGAIPAAIRRDGPEAVAGFRAGLGFERMLVAELLGEALPEQGSDPRAALLPETLADAIVAGGGLGLAAELAPGRSYAPQERDEAIA
jgi:hypothetical protein